jgi:pimeloyl-ACP methyl ester carboxylesterase
VLAAMRYPKRCPFPLRFVPQRPAWRFRLGLSLALVMIWAAATPRAATAQREKVIEAITPEEDLPAVKDFVLETKGATLENASGTDTTYAPGVRIVASYYPGDGVRGRDTVPVIMLHSDEGNRQDFHSLAIYLQQRHHAVIAPDLRGHGESTKTTESNIKLDAKKMSNAHFELMMAKGGDLERVKRFLVEEHNEGRLNIDKLCVVGAEELGGLVAMNWAMFDWAWPVLANYKQGQDVKAVVLLSPKEKFKTLKMTDALRSPAIRQKISFYIAVGASEPVRVKEAEKIYKALTRDRQKSEYDSEQPEDNSLFFTNDKLKTTLQGAHLLDQNLPVEKQIAEFIDVRIEQQKIVWKTRKKPL